MGHHDQGEDVFAPEFAEQGVTRSDRAGGERAERIAGKRSAAAELAKRFFVFGQFRDVFRPVLRSLSIPNLPKDADPGMRQTIWVTDAFAEALGRLDEQAFQSLYGRWDPLEPNQVAELFSGLSLRWYVAGGRAARVGAPARHHDDTDIAVRADDLDQLRQALADWHLWEAHSGSLRPLLPGVPVTEGCQGLWARRNAREPWQIDLLLDRSGDEWVFKRDARVRVPWERALQTVDGIAYLRPEIALLHKAHLDRQKDREDLAVARLDAHARAWLAQTLEQLGHHEWARQVSQ
jgi:hypothetical protein